MKKIVSILLIFLIFFQLFGFFVVFKYLQWDIKKQIKTAIKKGVPENELVVFRFPNNKKLQRKLGIRWIEGHEFKYNGNMYDVVKSVKKGNEVFYYCINDQQEKSLFANLKEQVDNAINNDTTKSKTLQLFKKMNFNYFIYKFEFNHNIEGINISLSAVLPIDFKNISKEVLTPPPQFA